MTSCDLVFWLNILGFALLVLGAFDGFKAIKTTHKAWFNDRELDLQPRWLARLRTRRGPDQVWAGSSATLHVTESSDTAEGFGRGRPPSFKPSPGWNEYFEATFQQTIARVNRLEQQVRALGSTMTEQAQEGRREIATTIETVKAATGVGQDGRGLVEAWWALTFIALGTILHLTALVIDRLW